MHDHSRKIHFQATLPLYTSTTVPSKEHAPQVLMKTELFISVSIIMDTQHIPAKTSTKTVVSPIFGMQPSFDPHRRNMKKKQCDPLFGLCNFNHKVKLFWHFQASWVPDFWYATIFLLKLNNSVKKWKGIIEQIEFYSFIHWYSYMTGIKLSN